MERKANLSASSFRDIPLCELCLEEALGIGKERTTKLKDSELAVTSIRFCVPGLRDWMSAYCDSYASMSLSAFMRDISWHWSSFCATNEPMVDLVKEYRALQRVITEKTAYTDLMEKARITPDAVRFGKTYSTPFTVFVPHEVAQIVNNVGHVLDIPFSRLFQVGLAWSLSTNRMGLYNPWVEGVAKPLTGSVMHTVTIKRKVLEETRIVLEYLLENPR
jgi:hypothetical protein